MVIKDTEDKVELQIKDSDGNVLVTIDRFPLMVSYIVTGYEQSVTGCGSLRSHVFVTQRKLM